jgi:hypothetical protein
MSTPESVATGGPEQYLTTDERASLQRILSDPAEFPREFGAWIVDYINLNATLQPFQVQGLSLQAPRVAAVNTAEDRSWSSSFGDLSTVGPSLEGLGSGTYLVLFSCEVQNFEAGVESCMSVSVNDATATETDGVTVFVSSVSYNAALVRFLVLTLTNPSNTIVAKYRRIGNGTTVATFRKRNLVAIKIGN